MTSEADLWAAVEADWENRVEAMVRRLERGELLDLAIRVHEARLREARRAEESLAIAITRARQARDAVVESTQTLERATRLAGADR